MARSKDSSVISGGSASKSPVRGAPRSPVKAAGGGPSSSSGPKVKPKARRYRPERELCEKLDFISATQIF